MATNISYFIHYPIAVLVACISCTFFAKYFFDNTITTLHTTWCLSVLLWC